ncbi:hypothetical protein PVAG01_01185 [Phlyctema vagabunda]|uniref:Uncharacterized protein n=1 Tax=Phlyctema vagabunda TaxID=108571 RepID=A0ABR4PWQ1_9HELO
MCVASIVSYDQCSCTRKFHEVCFPHAQHAPPQTGDQECENARTFYYHEHHHLLIPGADSASLDRLAGGPSGAETEACMRHNGSCTPRVEEYWAFQSEREYDAELAGVSDRDSYVEEKKWELQGRVPDSIEDGMAALDLAGDEEASFEQQDAADGYEVKEPGTEGIKATALPQDEDDEDYYFMEALFMDSARYIEESNIALQAAQKQYPVQEGGGSEEEDIGYGLGRKRGWMTGESDSDADDDDEELQLPPLKRCRAHSRHGEHEDTNDRETADHPASGQYPEDRLDAAAFQ